MMVVLVVAGVVLVMVLVVADVVLVLVQVLLQQTELKEL